MMTVFVLAVLWLIVVVPMIFRHHDERRREKSVDGFGKAMRALGRRAHPADARSEMSEARTAMMARRRRSLGILGAGAIVLTPTAFMIGGIMWVLAAPFPLG